MNRTQARKSLISVVSLEIFPQSELPPMIGVRVFAGRHRPEQNQGSSHSRNSVESGVRRRHTALCPPEQNAASTAKSPLNRPRLRLTMAIQPRPCKAAGPKAKLSWIQCSDIMKKPTPNNHRPRLLAIRPLRCRRAMRWPVKAISATGHQERDAVPQSVQHPKNDLGCKAHAGLAYAR